MELYARVRRAVQAEGISEREAARQFGLARETVRKMLRYSIPPGYRRQQPARRENHPRLKARVIQVGGGRVCFSPLCGGETNNGLSRNFRDA